MDFPQSNLVFVLLMLINYYIINLILMTELRLPQVITEYIWKFAIFLAKWLDFHSTLSYLILFFEVKYYCFDNEFSTFLIMSLLITKIVFKLANCLANIRKLPKKFPNNTSFYFSQSQYCLLSITRDESQIWILLPKGKFFIELKSFKSAVIWDTISTCTYLGMSSETFIRISLFYELSQIAQNRSNSSKKRVKLHLLFLYYLDQDWS